MLSFLSCPRLVDLSLLNLAQSSKAALDLTKATPTCRCPRISAPTPSAMGCVGWCFPRPPTANCPGALSWHLRLWAPHSERPIFLSQLLTLSLCRKLILNNRHMRS